MIKKADAVTVTSEYLHHHIGDPQKTHIIRNGCEFDKFAQASTNQSDDIIRVGYVGAVSTWFAVGLSKASSVYAPFFLAGIYTSELVFLHHTNLMFLCLISFPFLFPSPKLRRTILWREIAMVRHETSFSFVPSCSLVLSSRKCKLCCMLV